jgi:uncharacterized protein (TIGR04255 family)
LRRAPIIEALIDLQTLPREGLTLDELKAALELAKLGYYVKGPMARGQFSLTLPPDGKDPGSTATASQVGWRLHSDDDKYVLQCRLNGMTLSRLEPYEDWDALLRETRRIWRVYHDRLQPVKVTRIATRYVNNLRLPMAEGVSFQEYLIKLVDVPEGIPQLVRSFFQRFELADIHAGATVVLILSLTEGSATRELPVIFDIDAFSVGDFAPTEESLTKQLERLREAKNRVFFGTLTERALELYQ